MPLPMWTAKNNVQLPSVTKLRYLAGRNHDPYLEENILAGKNSHRAVGNPEMEFGGKTDIYKKNKVRVPSICVQHNIIFMSTTLSWNWEENMTVAEKKIE